MEVRDGTESKNFDNKVHYGVVAQELKIIFGVN